MKVLPRFACVVAMALITAAPAYSQNYYDLVFDNPVQSTNATHSQLGDYYTGTTYDFLNVAPGSGQNVDMRLTATGITSPRYTYNGAVPNFGSVPGEPAGDLGLLFSYTGGTGPGANLGAGGVTYHLEFFSGGSGFSDPFSIPDFRLMIYEIDGESTQDEAVAAFDADGLVSYQLASSTSLSVQTGDGYRLFTGPGVDRPYSDTRTAVLLRYHDTSSINLQFLANTRSGSPNNNGVLGAVDGNMSFINTGSLAAPVYIVPEPSCAMLSLLAASALAGRRKRS
jgi:hypothetical protein